MCIHPNDNDGGDYGVNSAVKKPKHSKAQSTMPSREVGIVDWALLCFGFLRQNYSRTK